MNFIENFHQNMKLMNILAGKRPFYLKGAKNWTLYAI